MKLKQSAKFLAGILSATTMFSTFSPTLCAMMSSEEASQESWTSTVESDVDIHTLIKESKIKGNDLLKLFLAHPELGTKKDANGNTPFDLAMLNKSPGDVVEVCFAFRLSVGEGKSIVWKRIGGWRTKWGPIFMSPVVLLSGIPGAPDGFPMRNDPIYGVELLRLYDTDDMLNNSEDAIKRGFPKYVMNREGERVAMGTKHRELSQSPVIRKFIEAVILGNEGLARVLLPSIKEELLKVPVAKINRRNGRNTTLPVLGCYRRILESAFNFTIMNNDTIMAKTLLDYCQSNLTVSDIMGNPHIKRGVKGFEFGMLSERLVDYVQAGGLNETAQLYLTHPFISDKLTPKASALARKMLPSSSPRKALPAPKSTAKKH